MEKVWRRVDFEPFGKRETCAEGQTLMEAAQRAGVALVAFCGGAGSCGRCRVRVLEGHVSSPTSTEEKALGADALAVGYRLACQTRVLDNVKVYVPLESVGTTQRLEVEGREVATAVVPPVCGYAVEVPAPTLEDLRSDSVRVGDALREQHGIAAIEMDFAVVQELPNRLREQKWQGTVFVRHTGDGREAVRFGAAREVPVGLAVDLGTTKIAAFLLDLHTGKTLAADGEMNPQIAFGEDVMARIAHAMKGNSEALKLRRAVVGSISGLAAKLCQKVNRKPEEIVEAVVVGNTAMHHLFLGLPVAQLGMAPYVPAESNPMDVKARDLGLRFAPGCYVHLLPNVAGFIGADHVAMLLGTRIPEMEGVVLGLDIGTNTELVLKTDSRIITCSTASGPAFEGAHIRDGMRAASGAIEWVDLEDGEIRWQTIGKVAPVGMCGSGVLDAVAALRIAGIMDARGRLGEHPRVQRGKDGPEFVLVDAERTGHGRAIALTRKDVAAIQLAKGAIRAGIELLMGEGGVRAEQLDKVILAGAFGTYLSVGSVLTIGLLPPVPAEKVEQVGNAAGVGARLALISLEERERARQYAVRAEYLELTTLPQFAEVFARAMILD
jgi:uncharacterized 2Fe-2S/4Fe-4S cluster protein (DUF4445 family)